MTLMLSSTGVSGAGMGAGISDCSQLDLELPVTACPRCALSEQLKWSHWIKHPLNIHQGRHRHICPEEKEALVEFKVLLLANFVEKSEVVV